MPGHLNFHQIFTHQPLLFHNGCHLTHDEEYRADNRDGHLLEPWLKLRLSILSITLFHCIETDDLISKPASQIHFSHSR